MSAVFFIAGRLRIFVVLICFFRFPNGLPACPKLAFPLSCGNGLVPRRFAPLLRHTADDRRQPVRDGGSHPHRCSIGVLTAYSSPMYAPKLLKSRSRSGLLAGIPSVLYASSAWLPSCPLPGTHPSRDLWHHDPAHRDRALRKALWRRAGAVLSGSTGPWVGPLPSVFLWCSAAKSGILAPCAGRGPRLGETWP
jgi:hypothetical protein